MPSTTSTMTSRERILATVRQQEVDRFPVWLKLANETWRLGQPDAVRALSEPDLLAAAGCDLMLGNGVRSELVRPRITVRRSDTGDRTVITYATPEGDLVEEIGHDAATRTSHPLRHPVQDADDLRRLRWCFRDTTTTVDAAAVAAAADRQRELAAAGAVTMTGIGPGPLMDLVERWCGPENAVFLRHDEPELFAEVLDLMHRSRLEQLRVLLPTVAADTFWLTENTSTTLISPDIFRTCCAPHLRDYGALVAAQGIIPVHHMCGHLNALLEDIDALPALVNEAYTTRPVGNASLDEGRRRMPSKSLWGGTNATLWLKSAETIIAEVAADLERCPDHRGIFLTSAGVLPPRVDLAKAQAVVAGLRALPWRGGATLARS